MKYNLCIPIPIRYSSIKELKPVIDKAIKSKVNLIELRFDYIQNIESISMEFIRNLLIIIHPHASVIFTLRNISEGGQIQLKQDDRFKIYKMFIFARPNYVDFEMNTEDKFLVEIINLAYQNGVKLIFSYHNFERTLSFDETTKYIDNFNKKLTQELNLDLNLIRDSIYKIVFTAQTFDDNLIPLRLCKEFSSSNKRIISFCMGELGIFSRINCIIVGSHLTYAFLEEKTAEGQISVERMREIYDLILK
ncbi:MAG: type I 3-dehydroquinate dehydratase [Promethearchaeota archaeon]